MTVRCDWARNALAVRYHDTEWGVPSRDDRYLFEMLILEGAQAGLSWDTILGKREHYRRAFSGFDVARVARFDRRRMQRLLADPGIVRNRLKIEAAVANARAVLAVEKEWGSFADYLWRFVDGTPVRNGWTSRAQIPVDSPHSKRMSRDMLGRGFKFVGPTICYAFMQAVGLVNDHVRQCFRYREV